jgi:hypothetical protein
MPGPKIMPEISTFTSLLINSAPGEYIGSRAADGDGDIILGPTVGNLGSDFTADLDDNPIIQTTHWQQTT